MQVGIAELRAWLSEYLARRQTGKELIVEDRSRHPARIVPTRWKQTGEEDGRPVDLQRRGVLRLGRFGFGRCRQGQ